MTYLWAPDDSDLPKLTLYDRAEGTKTVLQDDVISYRRVAWDGPLAIMSETTEGSLKVAHVSYYDLATGEVNEVASFFLAAGMEETLFLLPPAFLWDVAPVKKWVALSIYDKALISPELEKNKDQPSLYLVNPKQEGAHKVADQGVVPAFSPDESALCYIGPMGVGDDTPVIYLYDLGTQESRMLEGTIGVATVFWVDNQTLGFTIEIADDNYKLMQLSLPTGKVTQLFPEV